MGIEKHLSELITNNVIDEKIASDISQYYMNKGKNVSNNKIVLAFAIIGSVFVGLGTIVLIAYNWHFFNKSVKLFFSLLPLISSSACGLYVVLKKNKQQIWKESVSIIQFFTIGASLAMISQIYQLQGETYQFVLLWVITALPLLFLYNSKVTTILLTSYITYYAIGYYFENSLKMTPLLYWLIIAIIIFHTYKFYDKNKNRRLLKIISFITVISISMIFASIFTNASATETTIIRSWAYLIFSSLLITLSNYSEIIGPYDKKSLQVVGYLGMLSTLITLSFDGFWQIQGAFPRSSILQFNMDLLLVIAIFCMQSIISLNRIKHQGIAKIDYYELIPIIFVPIFLGGIYLDVGAIFTNLIILALGTITIVAGNRQNNILIVNYGMLIISILIICRFFDTEMPLLAKGIVFILIGCGFFAYNLILQRRKKNNAT